MYTHFKRVFLLCLFLPAAALAKVDLDDLRDLITRGKYPEAMQSAEAEISAGNRDTALRFYYAYAAAQLGLTDKAIAEFQQLAKELPKAPEPRNNLAALYAQQGELDKARVELEAALATHPSYATAHRNLGEIFSAMATQAYNRALARDEKRPAPAPRLSLLDSMQLPVAAQLAPAPAKLEPTPAAAPAAEAAKPPSMAPPPKTAAPAAGAPAKVAANTQAAPAAPAASANKPAPPKDANPPRPPAAAPAPKPAPATPTAAAVPAPAAPAPAAKAKTEPAPAAVSASSGLEQQARAVTEAVQAWAKAWTAQDADAYLAAYAGNFQPEGGVARAEWAKLRRDRLTRPKRVEVKLIDMQIKLLTDTTAQARFLQFYSSDVMEDTVEKRLDLVRDGGGWKILREQVGQRQY